jgi:2-dehydropantoate 2-reductase
MKILVLGAGAVGGYFGGRLLEAGADVTFLVRPRRADRLAREGLVVRSAFGDSVLPAPVVTRDRLRPVHDVVFLACKAYDLEDAMEAVHPAAAPGCAVLPLLNGVRHLDRLRDRFGPDAVLGGTCHIAATLSPSGEILHLNNLHRIRFGELDGRETPRVAELAEAFARTRVDSAAISNIVEEMWEKWVFLATLAVVTCTFRASVGDILATDDGEGLIAQALDACVRIAEAEGHPPRESALAMPRQHLFQRDSTFTASMLRDMERGSDAIEAEQIVGDMLARGRRHGIEAPMLVVANAHLQAYLARRRRESANT